MTRRGSAIHAMLLAFAATAPSVPSIATAAGEPGAPQTITIAAVEPVEEAVTGERRATFVLAHTREGACFAIAPPGGEGIEAGDAYIVVPASQVDEALKQNLSKLMREGPESDLVLTENAQPALMAVSVAVVRILEKDGGKPLASLVSHVAGHSLGEYSALAAAGSLQLADAARLLKLRGQSMQKAVPVGVGAMAALLGIELEGAQEACKEAAQGEVVASTVGTYQLRRLG